MTSLPVLLRKALEVVLPAHCVGCGVSGTYLCDACVAGMDRPSSVTSKLDEYAFDSVTSAFAYSDVARTAVHRLKFGGLRALAPTMARAMAPAVGQRTKFDVVVSVPLHRSRLRERGYNQAELLAEGVSAAFGLPLDTGLLKRVRQASTQVGSSAIERQANVRGAFEASPGSFGLRVLLVDDVTTTDATLDSASGALKDAGAAAVHALTFAKDL